MSELVTMIEVASNAIGFVGRLIGKGRINGKVVDEDDRPLRGVGVSVDGGKSIYSTMSGTFIIENIKGKCLIGVEYKGISEPDFDVLFVKPGQEKVIKLVLSQDFFNLIDNNVETGKNVFDINESRRHSIGDKNIRDNSNNINEKDKEVEAEIDRNITIKRKGLKNNKKKTRSDRYKFFEKLIDKCNERCDIFNSISSQNHSNWIAASTGFRKVTFQFVALKNKSRLELYFYDDEAIVNASKFNKLYKFKNEIEAKLGFNLIWDFNAGRKHQMIRYLIESGGIKDIHKWPEIHDEMIDKLIDFNNVFLPYLADITK